MANCPTIDPAIGTAQTLIQSVNCYVESSVAQSYGALLGPGGELKGALTAALIIYVAIIGYRFMLGRTRLSVGDLVPRMLLIGALLALTTSWATYQTLVYDVLTDGPEEITQMVTSGQTPNRNVAERVDAVSKLLTDVAGQWGRSPLGIVASVGPQSSIADAANVARAKAESTGVNPLLPNPAPTMPATISANPFSSAPSYLGWSAMLLTLTSAGSIAMTKALLGLLLALGPAFALFALFENTRGLAVGWARAALFLAIVPLLATLTSLAMLAMLEPMALRLSNEAAQGVFSLNSALAIFIAVLVMTGIALLAIWVANMMVSGWAVKLKDQLTENSTAVANPYLVDLSGSAFGNTSGGPLAANQPRIDQMVQAIERANSYSHTQSVQRIDTRLSDVTPPQTQRSSNEMRVPRIGAPLPSAGKIALPSPLRPARAWS